jgi:hypothetical protein
MSVSRSKKSKIPASRARTAFCSLSKTDLRAGSGERRLQRNMIINSLRKTRLFNTATINLYDSDHGCFYLYTLDLSRQHHLDDECLQVIGQGLDSLHTLNLSGCLSVTDAGIQAMLFKHSLDDSGHRVPIFPLELQVQRLRDLNISFTRVSCQGFVAIGRMIVQNSQQGLFQTGSFSIDVSCCESLSRNALLHVCQRVCAEIGEDVILARAQPLIRREPLIKLEFPRWDDEDNFEVDRQLFWKLVMCGVYWWDGHHRVGPGQSISWLADRWDYLLRHAGIRNG